MNEEPQTLPLGLALGQLLPQARERARFARMLGRAAIVAGLVVDAAGMLRLNARHLERRFGEGYRSYRDAVLTWL